jgi:hypothetical protein
VPVAERVRVRETDDDEGRSLSRIIRRGSGSVVAWRRARTVRARAEHVFARMKTWKVLRDRRPKGDGIRTAMPGTARPHNLALAG